MLMRLFVLSVTTCGRAAKALELLREDKDKFDLVISDVYMPDMDGFKLLELVGLEMDLPVISKLFLHSFLLVSRRWAMIGLRIAVVRNLNSMLTSSCNKHAVIEMSTR